MGRMQTFGGVLVAAGVATAGVSAALGGSIVEELTIRWIRLRKFDHRRY